MSNSLFGTEAEGNGTGEATRVLSGGVESGGPPRLRRADRAQVQLRACSLEGMVEADHPVRVVWALVERWDLRAFEATVRARGEAPGRAATDPRLLVGLWLYAYTRGIGSGRELDRLCGESLPYLWLLGGVTVNYHTLNDFRVGHEKELDGLLTQMIAAMLSKDLVSVERITQDGTRVRAGAGRKSFKTRKELEANVIAAREHVEAMKGQEEDGGSTSRHRAAQARAAREKLERIEQALKELERVEQAKASQKSKPSKGSEASASETDPQARMMKMPEGGFAPGLNVQLAVTTAGRAIVGVEVSNAGSDVHQSVPMRQQVENRTGLKVKEHLLDGGYVGLESIDRATESGTTVYAPVPQSRKEGVDRYEPKPGDSEAVKAWRERMATEAAQAIYKQRASTSETVNGEMKRYRGLRDVMVRGIKKMRCVALWSALAYNVVHLGRALVG